jgi:hypothetical protein
MPYAFMKKDHGRIEGRGRIVTGVDFRHVCEIDPYQGTCPVAHVDTCTVLEALFKVF